MTPLDVGLACVGLLAHTVERWVRGSRRATWGVVVVLVATSAIPTLLIGSSQRPTDLTFDDVRLDHIPAMTSWVRLEGEIQLIGGTYRLHDSHDDRMYVIVVTPSPLPEGHTVVTGRIAASGGSGYGIVGTIEIDLPAVPRRDEPFGLILLPAVLGVVIAFGIRLGYPVIRREARSVVRGFPLAPGERVEARWSGRIASDVVDRRGMRGAISLTPITDMPDLSDLSIEDSNGMHSVRIRRASPVRNVRLCWVRRSEPGIEVHSSISDLVLSFADRAARDRLTLTLR